MADVWTLLQFL